jgi:drug/metabolite transporter (DMT)-like permease
MVDADAARRAAPARPPLTTAVVSSATTTLVRRRASSGAAPGAPASGSPGECGAASAGNTTGARYSSQRGRAPSDGFRAGPTPDGAPGKLPDGGVPYGVQPFSQPPGSRPGATAPLLPAGCKGVPPSSRWQRATALVAVPALTLATVLGYGLAMFVNSVTAVLLGEQSPAQALMLLAAGRALALLAALPLLAVLRLRSHPGGAPVALTRQALVPGAIAVSGNLAYLAYYALLSGGGQVSVLAPLVGLYSVVPVAVGLTLRGEARTPPKLAGIALSFVAVAILAFSGTAAGGGGKGNAPASPAGTALNVLYFAIVFATWGANDAVASGLRLDPLTTAVSSLGGQLVCALGFGLAAFAEATNDAAALAAALADAAASGIPPRAAPPRHVPFGLPHGAVLGANALAILAWLAFVRLGGLAPVSRFVPLVSLYTYVPALLAVALLGEALTPAKGVGLAVAGVAVVLLSVGWGGGRGASSAGTGKPAPQPSAAELELTPPPPAAAAAQQQEEAGREVLQQ